VVHAADAAGSNQAARPSDQAPHAGSRGPGICAGAACAQRRELPLPAPAAEASARLARRAFIARIAGRKSGTSGTKAEIGQNRTQTLMNTGFEQSSRTGTGKLEGVKVETVLGLLNAFEKWIRLQGFAQNSPKDHRQKVSRFFTFAADRGLVGERGRVELSAI